MDLLADFYFGRFVIFLEKKVISADAMLAALAECYFVKINTAITIQGCHLSFTSKVPDFSLIFP